MNNFWQKLNKPILSLAPMADVTDSAFRHIIAKYSKGELSETFRACLAQADEPSRANFQQKIMRAKRENGSESLSGLSSEECSSFDYVTYTEFVSADGLVLAPEKGKAKLLKDLEYTELERPIVAQLFTSKPEIMEKASALVLELGFDGLDINMGCPDKSVEKQGAGAALIKNPKLAREIIAAAKKGVQNKIPVSVKTRLGYNKDELEEWLPELLAENPAAIIIHARTRKEMSKVPARWERIKRAVEIRDTFYGESQEQGSRRLASATGASTRKFSAENYPCPENYVPETTDTQEKSLILGNGDVANIQDAIKKCEETGADGAMIGRAVFGNPWVFSNYKPTLKDKLSVLVEHSKLFEKNLGEVKSFAIMKKYFKSYLSGFDVPKEFKDKLMDTESAIEVEQLVKIFLE